MFEKFTERARKSLGQARIAALQLRHPYIGTEHILEGLLEQDAGGAVRIFCNCGVAVDDIRNKLRQLQDPGDGTVPAMLKLPFTPRAKQVFDLAGAEAEALGHSDIGTMHMLLGLLREGQGIAAQVLMASFDISRVRQEAARLYTPTIDDLRPAAVPPDYPDIQPVSEPMMLRMPGGWFKAANAIVVDRVSVGEGSNIWFGCVLRGDIAPIRIGKYTNIQDLACVHVDPEEENVIGDYVSVAHHALIHGKLVGDYSLIGMHAILMGGSVIGEGCIIAAGAVVTENKVIPPRSLVMGMPGKVVRQVSDTEFEHNKWRAMSYFENAKRWHERNSGVPDSPLGRGPGK